MNSYNLDLVQEKLNTCHPRQIINTIGEFKISLFEVDIEYITERKNKREARKYVLSKSLDPQKDLTDEIIKWQKDYNEQYKHRQISNVHILDSRCLGYIRI